MSWKEIKEVRYIVVHASDTPADKDIGVEEIRLMHLRRGWFDIGYHYVIRRDGSLENGRPMDRPGAHARGFNHLSLGICLVGQGDFTNKQYATLADLVMGLVDMHPDAQVLGYRDLPNVNNSSPGFDVVEWWAEESNDE